MMRSGPTRRRLQDIADVPPERLALPFERKVRPAFHPVGSQQQ